MRREELPLRTAIFAPVNPCAVVLLYARECPSIRSVSLDNARVVVDPLKDLLSPPLRIDSKDASKRRTIVE